MLLNLRIISIGTAMTPIAASIALAFAQRQPLFSRCQTENTTCYRLFHGTNEGLPGVTVDRYGDLYLLQSFHTPLEVGQYQEIVAAVEQQLGQSVLWVYNDRSGSNSRIDTAQQDPALRPVDAALADHEGLELGVRYRVRGRHQGQDPLLFLDLRNARRYVLENSQNKDVLNLFSYTCGVGLCAAKGGAREVVNIDFAQSALAVGKENAELNGFPESQISFVQSDFFPACRQLAGLPVAARRGKRLPSYPRLAPRQFDLVFLDPPRYASSAFGTVDLLRDYQSLLKPAILATKADGQLICCNNVAQVDMDTWRALVLRCAEKLERPVRDVQVISPAEDFPSPDGQPPLKTLMLQF